MSRGRFPLAILQSRVELVEDLGSYTVPPPLPPTNSDLGPTIFVGYLLVRAPIHGESRGTHGLCRRVHRELYSRHGTSTWIDRKAGRRGMVDLTGLPRETDSINP